MRIINRGLYLSVLIHENQESGALREIFQGTMIIHNTILGAIIIALIHVVFMFIKRIFSIMKRYSGLVKILLDPINSILHSAWDINIYPIDNKL